MSTLAVYTDGVADVFAASTPKQGPYVDEADKSALDFDNQSDEDDEDEAGSLYESMVEAGNEAVDFINTSFGVGDDVIVTVDGDETALLHDSVVVNIVEDEDEDEEEEEEEEGNCDGHSQDDGGDENDENSAVPSGESAQGEINMDNNASNLSQRSEGEWRLMDSDEESEASNHSSHTAGSSSQNKILAKPGCTCTPLKALTEFDDGERGVRGAGGWKSIEVAGGVVADTLFGMQDDVAGVASAASGPDGPAPPPPPVDEWKTAKTPTGKTYFYNRRTRESSWKLPKGASTTDDAKIVAPKSTGKISSKSVSRAFATSADATTAAAISTPNRNPNSSSMAHAQAQMTPENVDHQQRQRSKGSRSEARQHKMKKIATAAKEEAVAVSKDNLVNLTERNTTLEANRRSVAATSRAESAAKSASRVLENSRAYEELDRTFTNEISFNPHTNPNLSSLANNPISTLSNPKKPQTTPSSKLTPPPNLTHNASRRRLFDENAAAVPSVYCVYCGISTPPSELNAHMNNCFVFQRTWEEKKETQKTIERAIMTAWGLNLVGGSSTGKNKSNLPEVKSATESCDLCKRTFRKGRLEAHRKVCMSVFGGERKVGKKVGLTPGKGSIGKAAVCNVVSPDNNNNDSSGSRPAAGSTPPHFVCSSCGDHNFESRESFLKHMRACASAVSVASNTNAAFKGRAGANQVCPYCAQPTIKLSNHLARCRQAKKAIAKKKESANEAGLPFDAVMSMTC